MMNESGKVSVTVRNSSTPAAPIRVTSARRVSRAERPAMHEQFDGNAPGLAPQRKQLVRDRDHLAGSFHLTSRAWCNRARSGTRSIRQSLAAPASKLTRYRSTLSSNRPRPSAVLQWQPVVYEASS